MPLALKERRVELSPNRSFIVTLEQQPSKFGYDIIFSASHPGQLVNVMGKVRLSSISEVDRLVAENENKLENLAETQQDHIKGIQNGTEAPRYAFISPEIKVEGGDHTDDSRFKMLILKDMIKWAISPENMQGGGYTNIESIVYSFGQNKDKRLQAEDYIFLEENGFQEIPLTNKNINQRTLYVVSPDKPELGTLVLMKYSALG